MLTYNLQEPDESYPGPKDPKDEMMASLDTLMRATLDPRTTEMR